MPGFFCIKTSSEVNLRYACIMECRDLLISVSFVWWDTERVLEFLYKIGDSWLSEFFSMSGDIMCPFSSLYNLTHLFSLAEFLACKVANDLSSLELCDCNGQPAKCQAKCWISELCLSNFKCGQWSDHLWVFLLGLKLPQR